MTSIVHYWPQELLKHSSVGHAALQIDGVHGQIYISWYPNSGAVKTVTGATGAARSYEEDLKRDYSARLVHLDGLDELKMIQKWKVRGGESYSLFGDNCAQTVTNFLRIGGAQELIDSWWSRNVTHRQWTYWSPKDTYRFALAVQNALTASHS